MEDKERELIAAAKIGENGLLKELLTLLNKMGGCGCSKCWGAKKQAIISTLRREMPMTDQRCDYDVTPKVTATMARMMSEHKEDMLRCAGMDWKQPALDDLACLIFNTYEPQDKLDDRMKNAERVAAAIREKFYLEKYRPDGAITDLKLLRDMCTRLERELASTKQALSETTKCAANLERELGEAKVQLWQIRTIVNKSTGNAQ